MLRAARQKKRVRRNRLAVQERRYASGWKSERNHPSYREKVRAVQATMGDVEKNMWSGSTASPNTYARFLWKNRAQTPPGFRRRYSSRVSTNGTNAPGTAARPLGRRHRLGTGTADAHALAGRASRSGRTMAGQRHRVEQRFQLGAFAKRRPTAHGTPACCHSRAWVLFTVLESAAGGFTTTRAAPCGQLGDLRRLRIAVRIALAQRIGHPEHHGAGTGRDRRQCAGAGLVHQMRSASAGS